jgi:ribosomal protein S1
MLQLWLLKGKEQMIVDFLDAAGIKHDGKGQVDDLPETLDAKQVKDGIDAMLKNHPAEHVSLYLHVFQLQRPEGWPTIAEALEKREELKLGAAA